MKATHESEASRIKELSEPEASQALLQLLCKEPQPLHSAVSPLPLPGPALRGGDLASRPLPLHAVVYLNLPVAGVVSVLNSATGTPLAATWGANIAAG